MVVWVSSDQNRKTLEDFVGKRRVTGLHIQNQKPPGSDLFRQFNVYFTPASYLLDRDGRIVAKFLRKQDISLEAVA